MPARATSLPITVDNREVCFARTFLPQLVLYMEYCLSPDVYSAMPFLPSPAEDHVYSSHIMMALANLSPLQSWAFFDGQTWTKLQNLC